MLMEQKKLRAAISLATRKDKRAEAVSILEQTDSKVVLAAKWHPWQRAQPCEPVSDANSAKSISSSADKLATANEIRKKNPRVSFVPSLSTIRTCSLVGFHAA